MRANISAGGGIRVAACRALPALVVIFALGAMSASTGAASAAPAPSGAATVENAWARSFPVPSCGWAPSSLVSKTIDDPVRAEKPAWMTVFAPILVCQYVERRPQLQLGNDPIVIVRYAENQRFMPPVGSTFVRGLGRCRNNVTCPSPHEPAWLYIRQDLTQPGPQGLPFVSGVDLRVQDGLNAIEIMVDNPDGPLAVASEAKQAERLARKLLPKFSWR
jgi:hypothetical protein